MFLVFPYRIDRSFRFPHATVGLIMANVVVFVGTLGATPDIWVQLGFIPDVQGLITWFTYMFLHADIVHLASNMYFLWLFGSVVEDALGRMRFLGVYAAGGLAAALFDALVTLILQPSAPPVPLIGASGALAAIIGVFAVRLRHHRVSFWYLLLIKPGTFKLPSMVAVGLYLVQETLYGVVGTFGPPGGAAHWAHVGGLLFGIAIARWTTIRREGTTEHLLEDAVGWGATGVPAVAASRYGALAAEDPEEPRWRVKQAAALLEAGGPAAARAGAEAARAIGDLLRAGRASDAAGGYRELGAHSREATLSPDVLQAIASSAESSGSARTAIDAYTELIERHPTSRQAERAWFRLAHVYLLAGHDAYAGEAWGRFTALYPASEWLAFADPRLARRQPASRRPAAADRS